MEKSGNANEGMWQSIEEFVKECLIAIGRKVNFKVLQSHSKVYDEFYVGLFGVLKKYLKTCSNGLIW